MKIDTLFIVGPTASGKSALAMQLATELNGEIICADSQTVRRGMNIGTAKPTAADQLAVPHHLLDVIDPNEAYSAAQFKRDAEAAIADIKSRGKSAIVVGGTGLYIDALFYDLPMREVIDETDYSDASVEELQKLITAKSLPMPQNDQNKRHLQNVLKTGQIRAGDKQISKYPESVIVGLDVGRDVLQERINDRVEAMFAGGFVAEVKTVIAKYGLPNEGFDAPAYNIVVAYLNGEMTEKGAKELIKISDRQYAKRQMTWLKRNPSILWFTSSADAHKCVLAKITV